jgi:hypothetical protein
MAKTSIDWRGSVGFCPGQTAEAIGAGHPAWHSLRGSFSTGCADKVYVLALDA